MGPAPRTGLNNWDMPLFQKIRYTKDELRYVQLRLEVFNAPNHTESDSSDRG